MEIVNLVGGVQVPSDTKTILSDQGFLAFCYERRRLIGRDVLVA